MLGNNWGPEFFSDVEHDRVRSPLQRIADETLEELAYFETVLKDFGCEVIRPEIDSNDRIQDFIEQGEVPRNPMQPRDEQLISGNKLYTTNTDNPSIVKRLLEYSEDITYFQDIYYDDAFYNERKHPGLADEELYANFAGADWPSYEYFCNNRKNPQAFEKHIYKELTTTLQKFPVDVPDQHPWAKTPGHVKGLHFPSSANSFLIGNDVYVSKGNDLSLAQLEQVFPDTRINVLLHGHTHSDGCFHPIKPGAILSLHDFQEYEKSFPGWEVSYLEGDLAPAVEPWRDLKRKQKGASSLGAAWWLPGEEKNNHLTHFVNEWLDNWVGYIEESVFDVNVLVLDKHHVCVSSLKNETLNAFLKKHKMEAIYIPWRHRYFWDGGLHCITLDLVREGQKQDYFPDRKEPIRLAELEGGYKTWIPGSPHQVKIPPQGLK